MFKLEVPIKVPYTDRMKNKKYKGVQVYSGYGEMSFCNKDGDVRSWVSDKNIEDFSKVVTDELLDECVKEYTDDGTSKSDAYRYASEWINEEMNKVLNEKEICISFNEEVFYFIVSEDSEWYNKLDKENDELTEYLQNIDW